MSDVVAGSEPGYWRVVCSNHSSCFLISINIESHSLLSVSLCNSIILNARVGLRNRNIILWLTLIRDFKLISTEHEERTINLPDMMMGLRSEVNPHMVTDDRLERFLPDKEGGRRERIWWWLWCFLSRPTTPTLSPLTDWQKWSISRRNKISTLGGARNVHLFNLEPGMVSCS